MIVGYRVANQQISLAKMLHASTVMNVRTVTSCTSSGITCTTTPNPVFEADVQDAMREMFNNGTCIVWPAGNGLGGWSCTSSGFANNHPGPYLPFGPFLPSYDERVIIVSSTDKGDMHYFNNGSERTHAHFPEVDICAPGHDLLTCTSTGCGANTWPYYGSSGGTSFSSPFVAGICALIISVNPCFGAEDVQAIIKATADPIADEADYAGLLGAGRINAHQACLMALDYGHYPPIVTSQTWSDNRFVADDLIIEPGVALTVTGTLRFADGAKVIVKRGAKLVLDGGRLTKAQGCHDDFWPGIEVWGSNAHNQLPGNHPTHQGMVVLKNGAVIEHAREAITMQEAGVWGTFGGVVQATDASFLNCRRAVEFLSYQGTTPGGSIMANRSFFNRVVFEVNDDYRGSNDFYAHVSMWDVTGIRFTQCDFINAQSTPGTIQESQHLGKGIISLDANFSVSGKCNVIIACAPGQAIPSCPTGELHPSRFIGLDHGINASQFYTGRNFTVHTTEFTNNVCGIYTRSVNNFSVLRSTFVGGDRDVDMGNNPQEEYWQGAHRAIYNYRGNGFRIEENSFGKDPGAPSGLQVEAVVNGYTGAYNDQVYKNTATGVDQGFVGEGNCLDYANNPSSVGLSFLCNTNVDNVGRDMAVRIPFNGPPGPDNLIRMFQGSVNVGAGNTFSPTQNGPYTYYNFENEPELVSIQYFENGPAMVQGAYNFPWVMEVPTALNSHGCPSRMVCGGGLQVKQHLGPQLDQTKLAYLNLKYVYESLLDGGDFEGLKETIMLTWPNEAWALRDELMSRSPYLSVEILFEAALRNILPTPMMLEICLANPEATQRGGFIRWIEHEAPNPLPNYMVAQIVASWDQRTWRTSLESGLAEQLGEMNRLSAAIIGALRADTIPEPLDSVMVYWQSDPTLGARYGEARTLIEMGQFAAATALMEGLEDSYRLKDQDTEERDDMLALIALLADVHGNGLNVMDLGQQHLDALAAIGDGRPTHAGIAAQNLLCFGYGQCTPPVTGGSMQPRSQWTGRSTATVAPVVLRAYPNPASVFVTLEHQVDARLKNAYLRMCDMTGRELERRNVAASPGQELWDTRRLSPGVYSVEFYNGTELLGSQKVVVQP